MKMPYIKFYPRDWLASLDVRGCSYAARGLWIDMLCIMAGNARYGYLEQNGKQMTADDLERITMGERDTVKGLLAELEQAGVFSRDDKGCIFCRRLIRDMEKHEIFSEFGKRGNKRIPEIPIPIPNAIPIPIPIPTKGTSLPPQPTLGPRLEPTLHNEAVNSVNVNITSGQFTLEQCKAAALTIAMLPDMIQDFFDHYNRQGWVLANGRPIVNLASALAKWKKDQPSHGKQANGAQQKDDAPFKQKSWEIPYTPTKIKVL
jgi:hypothetical protein